MSGRDGRWSLGQRVKNDALYVLAAVALRVALRVPRRWLAGSGRALGAIAHWAMPAARRMAIENLARVHPSWRRDEVRKQAREVFMTLGACLTDTIALLDPRERADRTLELDDRSARALDQALAQRCGVVFVTGHLGPWERMAALLAARGYPISTVARESYDGRFHRLVYDRLRDHRNVSPIYRGASGAAYAIVRALRRGRVVGFLMDLPGRVPTAEVTLLGCPARLALGPVRIALRTRAAVVIGTPAPGGSSRLGVRIETIRTDDLGPRDEAELAARIADALGARISALPTHWPWMHPSFTPPNEGPPHPHRSRSATRARA